VCAHLLNHIRLPASDGPILVCIACSLHCYTDTVHTIAASPHVSPQALETLVESLLDCLLENPIERALHREE